MSVDTTISVEMMEGERMEMKKGEVPYGLVWDKNEISSEVENTFIAYFSNFFNLFSLDQSPISCPLLLKDRDRATYGTSQMW